MVSAVTDTIGTLAAFVVALSVIVAVHEYGHYIVARWSGIKSDVFSLGFGPRLISRRDRRGTLWQVAAIPLGGYVQFAGDTNPASIGPGAAADSGSRLQSLAAAPLWARVATVSAGPVFNFILSTLIFAGFALVRGVPATEVTVGTLAPTPPGIEMQLQPGDRVIALDGRPVAAWADLSMIAQSLPEAPAHDWTVRRDGAEITVTGPDPMPARVSGIAPRGAAADAGLRPGDVVLAVDGVPVSRFTQLREKVDAAQGKPLALAIWREGQGDLTVTLSPREQDVPKAEGGFEKRWLIGITGGETFFAPATRSTGPFEAIWLGLGQTWLVITSSITGLWAIVSGQIGSCNLGGAISIAQTSGQAASDGGDSFLWWIAVLSAAIGFLNLLPVPVLDGGHLAFYGYEALTGRPPSDRAMNALTTVGLALVLGLMIFGLSNDLFCP